jgi:hypothetical protein
MIKFALWLAVSIAITFLFPIPGCAIPAIALLGVLTYLIIRM